VSRFVAFQFPISVWRLICGELLPRRPRLCVDGDRDQIAQVLFNLVLKARPEEARRAPAQPGEAAPKKAHSQASGARALVIDDEIRITELVATILAARGCQTVTLNDSTLAEAAFEQQDFDLVVCDLKMPGRSGAEILRWLREKRPPLARRFLLMTGNLSDANERDLRDLADVPILRKPFTLDQISQAVENLLGGRR
jgi:CheY-like chemotaxis protein